MAMARAWWRPPHSPLAWAAALAPSISTSRAPQSISSSTSSASSRNNPSLRRVLRNAPNTDARSFQREGTGVTVERPLEAGVDAADHAEAAQVKHLHRLINVVGELEV